MRVNGPDLNLSSPGKPATIYDVSEHLFSEPALFPMYKGEPNEPNVNESIA
jgi:hypothetical protein